MKLKTPISIQLAPGADPITFSTDVKFLEWIEGQSEKWNELTTKIAVVANRIPNAMIWLEQLNSGWRSWSAIGKNIAGQYSLEQQENELNQLAHKLQEQLNKQVILWSGDSVVQKAMHFADFDPSASCWLLLFRVGQLRWLLVDHNNPEYWSSFANAITKLVDSKDASFQKRQQIAIEKIELLAATASEKISEFYKKTDTNEKEYSALQASLKDRSDQQLLEFSDEWKKLRATYDAELKLRAPREYWIAKFSDHEKSAGNWRTSFFITAFISFLIIGFAIYEFGEGRLVIPTTLGNLGWIIPAGIIGIPAFLALWLLRLCGRQWSDHLMRREDARERKVMIETFLALSRDVDSPGAITDPAQLGLVLSSIFRPGPGLSTDDSPPAGFFEAVLNRMASDKR